MPAQEALYRVSDDGRDYLCAHCGKPLPEGALLTGTTAGVLAESHDGETLHACGDQKETRRG
jgi:hypothetical protein